MIRFIDSFFQPVDHNGVDWKILLFPIYHTLNATGFNQKTNQTRINIRVSDWMHSNNSMKVMTLVALYIGMSREQNFFSCNPTHGKIEMKFNQIDFKIEHMYFCKCPFALCNLVQSVWGNKAAHLKNLKIKLCLQNSWNFLLELFPRILSLFLPNHFRILDSRGVVVCD